MHQSIEVPNGTRQIAPHRLLEEDFAHLFVAEVEYEPGFGPGFHEIAFRHHYAHSAF
ncbi:protein of unknown function [Hyphomicrobium sp. MC1]|nr:protein of unknown function [Hyphomicrobium sp. MC1]